MSTTADKGHINQLIELIEHASVILRAIAAHCIDGAAEGNAPWPASAVLKASPALKRLETARRGLAALDYRVAEAVLHGEMARIRGTTRPDDYLAQEFRLTRAEARNRVSAVEFFAEHPDLDSRAARTMAEGDITFTAVNGMRKELANLHEDSPTHQGDIAAKVLERAPATGPHGAAGLARKLVRSANRPFPRDAAAANKARHVTVGKQDSDGGARVNAYLDAATLALLESWLISHGLKSGSRDDGRTMGQRNADALDLALRTAHEAAPRVKGKPMCTVVAELRRDELRSATGHGDGSLHPTRVTAATGTGTELGIADLLKLGLGPDVYLALVDPDAGVGAAKLNLGRTKRNASFEQRIALQILDGVCQHPGCNRPADTCDAHHIESWLRDGRTDLGNLTLVCRRHHTDNDDTLANPRRGHMTPRHAHPHGRTGWVEPIGADGTRRIRFNNSSAAREAGGWIAA